MMYLTSFVSVFDSVHPAWSIAMITAVLLCFYLVLDLHRLLLVTYNLQGREKSKRNMFFNYSFLHKYPVRRVSWSCFSTQ